MTEYTSMFGVARVIGLGEGRDANGATNLGASGAFHELKIHLTEAGAGFNKDANNDGIMDSFGRGVAHIPAGAAIASVDLKTNSVEGTANVQAGLYKKDGTEIAAAGLLTGAVSEPSLFSGEGEYIGNAVEEAAYVKVTVNGATALDAELIVLYVM